MQLNSSAPCEYLYFSHQKILRFSYCVLDWNGFYHILTTKDVDRARGGASAEELTDCSENEHGFRLEPKSDVMMMCWYRYTSAARESCIFPHDRDVK